MRQKAGHAGTLDPLATGVLPIAFGEATKTVPFAVDGTKTYRFTVRFGDATDSDDADGKITAEGGRIPSTGGDRSCAARPHRRYQQMPPRFSALKVAGDRAYDLAREERDFELAPPEALIGASSSSTCRMRKASRSRPNAERGPM